MYWPHIGTALLIAAHVWGQPACGTPRVVIQDRDPTHDGWALSGTCEIALTPRIRWSRDPAYRCSMIVHEWGHLTGHEHSPDPESIMYFQPGYYWRCAPDAGRARCACNLDEAATGARDPREFQRTPVVATLNQEG